MKWINVNHNHPFTIENWESKIFFRREKTKEVIPTDEMQIDFKNQTIHFGVMGKAQWFEVEWLDEGFNEMHEIANGIGIPPWSFKEPKDVINYIEHFKLTKRIEFESFQSDIGKALNIPLTEVSKPKILASITMLQLERNTARDENTQLRMSELKTDKNSLLAEALGYAGPISYEDLIKVVKDLKATEAEYRVTLANTLGIATPNRFEYLINEVKELKARAKNQADTIGEYQTLQNKLRNSDGIINELLNLKDKYYREIQYLNRINDQLKNDNVRLITAQDLKPTLSRDYLKADQNKNAQIAEALGIEEKHDMWDFDYLLECIGDLRDRKTRQEKTLNRDMLNKIAEALGLENTEDKNVYWVFDYLLDEIRKLKPVHAHVPKEMAIYSVDFIKKICEALNMKPSNAYEEVLIHAISSNTKQIGTYAGQFKDFKTEIAGLNKKIQGQAETIQIYTTEITGYRNEHHKQNTVIEKQELRITDLLKHNDWLKDLVIRLTNKPAREYMRPIVEEGKGEIKQPEVFAWQTDPGKIFETGPVQYWPMYKYEARHIWGDSKGKDLILWSPVNVESIAPDDVDILIKQGSLRELKKP